MPAVESLKGGVTFPPERADCIPAVQAKVGTSRTGSEGPTVWRVGAEPGCEANFRVKRCPRDATLVVRRWKCDEERRCASCSRVWAAGGAYRAARRFKAMWPKGAPRHVVISFPPASVALETLADVNDLYRAGRTILEVAGFDGGALILHGWRHEWLPAFEGEPGEVVWSHGPHIHALVYGWNHIAYIEGAVVKVIEGEGRSVYKTLAYLLDHAAYTARGHVLRWFGSAAYNRHPGAGRAPAQFGTGELCPKCGALMERYVGFDGVPIAMHYLDVAAVRKGESVVPGGGWG